MIDGLRNTVAQWLQNRRSDDALVAGSVATHRDDPASVLGNPLRSLTPVQAVGLLEQALRGEWTRIQWLMHLVEQIDADVFTIVDRRISGLRELDWTIRTDSKADERGLEKLAEAQQQALTERYMAILNMREAVEHLASAKFRSYAHLAIGEDGDAMSATQFYPLDQWWWLRDGMYGPWHWNGEARATSARACGPPVAEASYIIRSEPRSLIFLAVLKHLRTHYCQKWWDRFLEIAARRGTLIIAPPGLTGAAADEFQTHAANIAAGNSGWLPGGTTVQTTGPDAQGGTVTVWEGRMRYLREEVVLAGTGGMLTALSQATGIGGSQGEEQGNVWRSLLRSDARDISETLQRQFDRRVLETLFPGQPIVAWFELDTSEQPSADTVFDHAVKAAQAGYAIDADELAEQTGYTLSQSQSPVGSAYGTAVQPLGNRARGLRNRAEESAAPAAVTVPDLDVPDSWSAPVAEWMDRLEAASAQFATDEEFLSWVQSEVEKLPELARAMDIEGLAAALETGMQRAAASVIAGARADGVSDED